MKAEVHPTYYPNAKIVCACGNTFTVGSSVEEIHVELCSACHPFYTGTQKLIDTSRRIEKFAEKKTAQAEKGATATGKKVKTEKRAALKASKKSQKVPTSLDETKA